MIDIELPGAFDYDTKAVEFRINGVAHCAVVRSARRPESEAAISAYNAKLKRHAEKLTETVIEVDEYGNEYEVERKTALANKIESSLCRSLIVEHDYDGDGDFLLVSPPLRNEIMAAAATLAAEFAAKKKT